MKPVCARSWGQGHGKPWTFCVLEKGHAGACADWRGNVPDAPFFEDQPEAVEALRKQREQEAKREP